MRTIILLAGAAVSLAACGKPASDADGNATSTMAPAAAVATKIPSRVPGEWEYTTKVEMTDLQGGTPAMAERMKAAPQVSTRRACMTKEEAEEDVSKMVAKDQGGCRFERVQTAAATIAGTAICSSGGMEATGKMTGSVKPTEIDMNVDMTMKLPSPGTAPPSTLKMKMTMAGRRVGDCPKS